MTLTLHTRVALGLVGCMALSAGAHADRVALPGDGPQESQYPLSLTSLADWRPVQGAPVKVLGNSNSWRAGNAFALPPGASIETLIAVPPLPAYEAPFTRRLGVVALDLSGVLGSGKAACTLEVFDESGQLLGQALVTSDTPHTGGAGWSCDSEDVSEPLGAALDGNPHSLWHTDWHQATPLPHHLQWQADAPTTLGGFVYTPRQNWRTGMVKDWEVQTSMDGLSWQTAASGVFGYPERKLDAKKIQFKAPVTGRAFRFVAKSETTGDKNHASAAEFRFLDDKGQPLPISQSNAHIPARHPRAWVCLTPQTIAQLTPPTLDKGGEGAPPPKAPADAKKLRLRITSTGPNPAVIAGIAFTRPPVAADLKMAVKANSYGPFGPDYFASGMTGVQGLLSHGDIGIPLLAPIADSPAARAGLKNGDYLVAMDGVPLNPNFGHQQMGWLEDGHQATFGRAVADALRQDAKHPRALPLTVLRDGKLLNITVHLPESAPLWRPGAPAAADVMQWAGPALNDPLWDAMEKDMVAYLEKTQHPDGSWGTGGNTYIQTSWSGLALLQTGDPRHAERIARCADWCLKQPDLMNQWFWKVGYNGIFLSEYYLATGDKRVVPWIEKALAWLPMSTHTGARGPDIQAPGHGPEGLPYDNKGLIAPALHALLFEALAKHAGLRAPTPDFHAKLWNYLDYSYADPARGGNGAVDYSPQNKKPGAIDGFTECWARTGLFNEIETLRGPWPKGAVAGQTVNNHSHLMYGSHAYGMPGGSWGVATLAGYAPKDYEAVVRRHAWDWINAWQPGFGLRVSTPLMGQPYMGFEDLNNPAWLMALGARRHVLHLCGGTKRNWLDVSKLPAREGELRANVDVNGHTVLECAPTGAKVGYSRDMNGRMEDPQTHQADLDQGGWVLARAMDGDKPIGQPKWINLPESKRNWKVLSATGWATPEESLARAQLAIDNQDGTEWLTNAGNKPQPYPHQLVVDTGRVRLMGSVAFSRVNFGDFTISTSLDGKTWTKEEDTHWIKPNQADGNHCLTIHFDPPAKPVCFVRLDIRATATMPAQPGHAAPAGDPGLFLGELNVLEPAPVITQKAGVATLAAPAGFALVANTDGRQPHGKGPHLTLDKNGQAQLPLKPGQPLRARCVKGDWVGPEVVEVGK